VEIRFNETMTNIDDKASFFLCFSRQIEELVHHGSDAEGELQQGVERRLRGGRAVVDVRHRRRRRYRHRTRQGVAETLRRQVAEKGLHSETGDEPGEVKS